MNFKKLAEQKIDELSGKINITNSFGVKPIKFVLDENFNAPDVDVELITEEPENLFDGYLGEQKEVPNPLEYGPNATYRNLREGVVYKKGPDNLWEVFLQDGKPGKQGQSIGSGVGVEEVKKIDASRKVSTVDDIMKVKAFEEIEILFSDV